MVDQKHKTLRSFYCEDALWEMFEVMTRDLDCSMDYLINESMRHYARSRNYSLTGMGRHRPPEPAYRPPEPAYRPPEPAYRPPEPAYRPPEPAYRPPEPEYRPPARQPPPPPRAPAASARPDARTIPISAHELRGVAGQDWSGSAQGYPAGYRERPTPPIPPPPPREAPSSLPYGHGYSGAGYQEPSMPSRQPPAPPVPRSPVSPPARARGPAPGYAGKPVLYLFFNGQRYLIDKDRYIIGRGSQNTDLTIRDGNISRKHAAVIYHDGVYYLQDLGSTNGIEYKNARVASKQIEEGDLFNICDYELRFSYVG